VPDCAGFAVLALRGELDFTDAQVLSSWLADIVSREPWVIVDSAAEQGYLGAA
jgi:hypothetical protein